MSGKPVKVTLTGPQAAALLSAIAEVTAGDTEHWPAPELRALLNARDKIETAFPTTEG